MRRLELFEEAQGSGEKRMENNALHVETWVFNYLDGNLNIPFTPQTYLIAEEGAGCDSLS